MKNRILILIASVFLWATLYSCSEEPVGQTPTDRTPPGKITNPTVENLPGGARISYTLPAENDLLYVKAVYYVNGVEKTDAATLYANSVEVMGFGSTDEQSIKLYCVDRSGNQSEPVEVKIHPTTPPVTLIRESMTMFEGFGGVEIRWINQYKTPITIYLLAADSIGDIQVADVVYTSLEEGKFNLRGYNDTERLFGAYVRDRWDNFSDTLQGVFTPLYEEEMDKSKFRRQILMGDNTGVYSSTYAFEKMWDDRINSGDGCYIQNPESGVPNYFTIDLGVEAKLSRYTLWFRPEFEYDHWNLKYWKVYGTAAISTSTDADYWMEGWKDDWYLLADCYSFKPSGEGPVTQEDRDYSFMGFEFDIPTETPPVRFIRFHVLSTWGGSLSIQIAEVTFWGSVAKE